MREWQMRDATPADAKTIALLHVRSWMATYPNTLPDSSSWRKLVDSRASIWAARITGAREHHLLLGESQGAVAGFAWGGPTTDPDDDPACVGQVRSIHVDPDAQGHGCGAALLATLAERFTSSGCSQVTLWVVDGNQAARSFYESHGWKPDGTTRREPLAMPGEVGPMVTVLRYRARHGDLLRSPPDGA